MRTTVRNAHTAIADHATFTAASMSALNPTTDGWNGQYRGGSGRLPYDWSQTFYSDTADGRAYIVYSYSTPIGWERSDGLRVVPPVSYSVTTARHQSQLRRAWGMRWGQSYSHPTRSLVTL